MCVFFLFYLRREQCQREKLICCLLSVNGVCVCAVPGIRQIDRQPQRATSIDSETRKVDAGVERAVEAVEDV